MQLANISPYPVAQLIISHHNILCMTAAASFGSGLVVTGACTLVAAVVGSGFAAAAVKPCAALGTLAAGATSAYVGYQATKFVHANY